MSVISKIVVDTICISKSNNSYTMLSAGDDLPISRLMTEISMYIFFWVFIANEQAECHDTPWILSQVCQRWRGIALSYPKLWSWIDIEEPWTFNFSGCVHQLEVSLLRSQSYPLRIKYYESGDLNAHLWDVLLDHCDHWHIVGVYCSTTDFTCRLPKPQRHPLPLLEQFHLSRSFLDPFGTDFELDEDVLDVLTTAPRLHDIHVTGFRSPSSLNLPWFQLTKLDLKCGSAENDISILRKAPNLQQLFLTHHMYNLSLPAPIVHTSLHELHAPHAYALSHFTFPALKRLWIPITVGSTASPTPIIHKFIVRSQCTLQNLDLGGIDMDQSLINLLKDTPTVEVLNLYFGHLTLNAFETFSKSLTYPDADKPISDVLLPHLENLYMDIHFDLPMTHAFTAMVRSRWYVDQKRATRLRGLFCAAFTEASSDDVELLTQIIEEGLESCIVVSGRAVIWNHDL
ncbi:uncharacterized protein EV420DRAFT_1671143 [Desarmillaria tabescens]|uniref:F-box domain-containing protein n=1 Tax=Armillaria tabescens TaxID=1929756 RepID=A0AA39TV53_ARMTA|nr:uncharacterized protein EV420DRAFT_1671143 [Desarmillaria tabescens]KAK0460575.1 hypothetical protein EV420DRAFT_1671143 [Desarmillaria tabescens]